MLIIWFLVLLLLYTDDVCLGAHEPQCIGEVRGQCSRSQFSFHFHMALGIKLKLPGLHGTYLDPLTISTELGLQVCVSAWVLHVKLRPLCTD